MPVRHQPPLPDHWLHILLALTEGERHGLDIMRVVHETTGGHLRLWPGKLYGALRELRALGFVAEIEVAEAEPRGGNPRFYQLTPAGRERLRVELGRLASILALAESRDVLPQLASRRGRRESRGRA